MTWTMVGSCVGLVGLLLGVQFWAVRWALNRYAAHTSDRFAALESALQAHLQDEQKVARDLLKLRAELPERYVNRADWIRFGGVMDAKMDGLRESLDAMHAQLSVLKETMVGLKEKLNERHRTAGA